VGDAGIEKREEGERAMEGGKGKDDLHPTLFLGPVSGALPPVPLSDGLNTRPCKILDPRLL